MSGQTDDSDDSEYRPTDYLAICRLSYGYGSGEDDAVLNALRYAAPFDTEENDTVSVAVWKLYADSWTSHNPSGPERGAEELHFEEWELPVEVADEAADHASQANITLSRAYADGETVREVDNED